MAFKIKTQPLANAAWIFVVAVMWALPVGAQSPETGSGQAQARPNVILIVADDLSRSLCTFLPEGEGRSLMPNLDRLAREGVVFNQMHSPSPICTPSRFAILTGGYPSRCTHPHFLQESQRDGQTVVQFNTHLQTSDTTLPKLLQQAGYFTGAIGKNHVISVEGHQRIAYDADPSDPAVQATMASNATKLRDAYQACGFDFAQGLYFGNPDADGVRALAMHNQEWITEAGIRFMDQSDDRPFFLYMATTIPHGPFEDRRSWNADPLVTPEGPLTTPPQVQPARETIPQRLAEAGITGWNVENVLWLDDAVGALFDHLEATGKADNTIIIFVSDHGTEAKGSVYNRGTNTAGLVWRKGGFDAGQSVDADVTLMDLAPTLLEWAQAPTAEDQFDGRSLTPLLDGEVQTVHESLYFEVGYTRAVLMDGVKYLAVRYPEYAQTMSLEERTRRMEQRNRVLTMRGRPLPTEDPSTPFSHLTLIPGGSDAEQISIRNQPAYFDPNQIYNLSEDPTEQRNLIDDPAYAEKLEELKAELNRYIELVPGTFGEFGGE